MKAFITGINGFVGTHLLRFLLKKRWAVEGTIFGEINLDTVRELIGKHKAYLCDIRKKTSIERALKKAAPDVVFHLAAQSYVPLSWKNPELTFDVNVSGSIHLFDLIVRYFPEALLIAISTGDLYDLSAVSKKCTDEDTSIRPKNPYALSKLTVDLLAKQYYIASGLRVIRLRPFNHIGPGQDERFVASSFAKQIAEIEKKKRPPIIKVGNLDVKRDFTDVRDVVRAYWLAAKRCEIGQCYNVCSQKAHSIRYILRYLLKQPKMKIAVQKDESKYRPDEIKSICGKNSRFRKATGWKPKITIEETLSDMLQYWRNKVK